MSLLRLAILPVPSKEAPSLQVPVHLTWVVQERFPAWLSHFEGSGKISCVVKSLRGLKEHESTSGKLSLRCALGQAPQSQGLHRGTPSPWNRAWHTPAAQSAFAE